MSWNTAKKRFQREVENYPKALRDVYLAKTNKYTLPTFETKEWPLAKWERKTKLEQIGFANGDLAYITEGEKKGIVSTIFQYSPEMNSFLLADVTSKKLLPKQNWVEHQSSHLIDYPEYVKRDHIKLAAKDKDENGKVYYVVADDVVYKEKYYDERYRRWLPKRFVKHHDSIEIPWPNPPQEPKDDHLSTSQQAAFERTYELQSIAKPPVPTDALLQLRNPYSKHKKRVLSEAQARKVNAPDMPLSDEQKIYLAKKATEPKKVYKKLSEEIQDFIGSRMADHINKIDNPSLLAHLDALSESKIPDFAKTMKNIEDAEHEKQKKLHNQAI